MAPRTSHSTVLRRTPAVDKSIGVERTRAEFFERFRPVTERDLPKIGRQAGREAAQTFFICGH